MKISVKKILDKLKGLIKAENKIKFIIILGIAGVFLIAFSDLFSMQKPTETQTELIADEIIENSEKKLKSILENIEGVGNVEVMITYESTEEYVFATEDKKTSEKTDDSSKTQQKSDTESSVIIYETSDGKKALIKKTLLPKVQGVVVICEGGDSIYIKERIYDVVKTALNIPLSQICICEYKKS